MQNSKCKITVQKLKLLVLRFSFSLFALHFTLGLCLAQPVTSTELINNAKEYDGSTVVYEGEVIGDIMRRGDFVWLNVKDDKIALGIWAHNSLAKEIEFTGEYKSKGDRIQVSGIFNRACLEHGGELDIHAKSIKKLSSGKIIKERLIIGKRNLVIMLSGVIFLVWILMLLKRR